jgi:hypothetical protein
MLTFGFHCKKHEKWKNLYLKVNKIKLSEPVKFIKHGYEGQLVELSNKIIEKSLSDSYILSQIGKKIYH